MLKDKVARVEQYKNMAVDEPEKPFELLTGRYQREHQKE